MKNAAVQRLVIKAKTCFDHIDAQGHHLSNIEGVNLGISGSECGMRKLATVLSAGLVCSCVASAQAADLDGYEPAFSWTGFYVGANVGLANGQTDDTPSSFSFFGAGAPIPPAIGNIFASDYDLNDALYGGHVGYNFQSGNAVFGIEASFSGATIEGDGAQGPILFLSDREIDWIATVTGRIGYAFGQSLVYAKGGVAWADVTSEVRLGGVTILSGDETPVGWTAGVGFEHALSKNFTVRLEYAHIDLGSEDVTMPNTGALGLLPAGCCTIGTDVDLTLDTLTIGASYKF